MFSGDPAERRTYLDAGFDGAIDYPLHGALLRAFARREGVEAIVGTVHALTRELGPERVHGLVNFVDNHDVPRFVSEIPEDVPADEALSRYHLALVALFTLPGIPQLYYGNEIAMYGGRDPDNRRDMPSWAFDEKGRAALHPEDSLGTPAETFALVQQLVRLRRTSAALRSGEFEVLQASTADALVFARTLPQQRVVVALNTGDAPLEVPVEELQGASVVSVGSAQISDGILRVPGSSAVILGGR